MALWLATAVPPEASNGLTDLVLKGISIGSLITLIVGGLATSKLYTSRQVDQIVNRYEKHLDRTVENMQGRINDAVRREGEWRDVAMQFKDAFQTMEGVIEPMQFQSQTMLQIIRQIQTLQREGQSGE
jgi:hypothetical protein